MRRRCPCCRTSHKIEGPIISVSYRGSNQRERESYFIKTNELGSTSAFTTRRGEGDASKEFTTFFTTPSFSGPSSMPPADPVTYDADPFTNVEPPVTHYVDPVSRDHQEVKSVKFKSLERSWKLSPQHQVCHITWLAHTQCVILSQRKEGGERGEVEDIDDVRNAYCVFMPV